MYDCEKIIECEGCGIEIIVGRDYEGSKMCIDCEEDVSMIRCPLCNTSDIDGDWGNFYCGNCNIKIEVSEVRKMPSASKIPF